MTDSESASKAMRACGRPLVLFLGVVIVGIIGVSRFFVEFDGLLVVDKIRQPEDAEQIGKKRNNA